MTTVAVCVGLLCSDHKFPWWIVAAVVIDGVMAIPGAISAGLRLAHYLNWI